MYTIHSVAEGEKRKHAAWKPIWTKKANFREHITSGELVMAKLCRVDVVRKSHCFDSCPSKPCWFDWFWPTPSMLMECRQKTCKILKFDVYKMTRPDIQGCAVTCAAKDELGAGDNGQLTIHHAPSLYNGLYDASRCPSQTRVYTYVASRMAYRIKIAICRQGACNKVKCVLKFRHEDGLTWLNPCQILDCILLTIVRD